MSIIKTEKSNQELPSGIQHSSIFNENKENENNEPSLSLDDFEIYDPLGNGKFGYVYKSKFKHNNKVLAIKFINKNIVEQYNFFDQLEREITIQSRLK